MRSKSCIEGKRLLTRLSTSSCHLKMRTLQVRCDRLRGRIRHVARLFGDGDISTGSCRGTISKLGRLNVRLRIGRGGLSCAGLCTPASKCVRSIGFSPTRVISTKATVFALLSMSHVTIITSVPTRRCQQHKAFANCDYRIANVRKGVPVASPDFSPGTSSGRLCRLQLTFTRGPGQRLATKLGIRMDVAVASAISPAKCALPLHSIFCSGKGAYM